MSWTWAQSWFDLAKTDWLRVLEDRPEVTIRRDHASPAAWLTGKRILVLGCGALGGPAADSCVRARAASVVLVDNGIVTPGILVRQQYTDADIGKAKATALADRLRGVYRTTTVRGLVRDAVSIFTAPDATVARRRPHHRRDRRHRGPRRDRDRPLRAVRGRVATDPDHAGRPPGPPGLVALARSEATGAAHDIFRRFGLAINGPHRTAFADVADDFYPDPPRAATFQPEPGCSAPTFVGSAVEVTALAATMMSAALDALAGHADAAPDASQLPMAVAAVRLDTRDDHPSTGQGAAWLGWPNDTVITEERDHLQVRISATAMAEMRAETRRGARVRGDRIETGGMLVGPSTKPRCASTSTPRAARRPTAACQTCTSNTAPTAPSTSSTTTSNAATARADSSACGTPTPTASPHRARPTEPAWPASSPRYRRRDPGAHAHPRRRRRPPGRPGAATRAHRQPPDLYAALVRRAATARTAAGARTRGPDLPPRRVPPVATRRHGTPPSPMVEMVERRPATARKAGPR